MREGIQCTKGTPNIGRVACKAKAKQGVLHCAPINTAESETLSPLFFSFWRNSLNPIQL